MTDDYITAQEYEQKVEGTANMIAIELQDSFGDDPISTDEVWQAVDETVYSMPWFARTDNGTELYGAIIAHRRVEDPESRGGEWQHRVGGTLDRTLRDFAMECFRIDLSAAVNSHLSGQTYID